MDFMPPRLRHRRKERKRDSLWTPCCLIPDIVGRRRNKVACGLHTTSPSTLQERGETRRHVGSTPPRLQHCWKEGKQGGVWTPRHLVFDAAGRRRNKAAYGFHAASSLMLQKEEKRGGVWFPCRLVVNAAGWMGNNEAACGLHAVSSSMPQEGGETMRRRVGFTRPHRVLGSSLVPIVLFATIPPHCSPPHSPSLTTGCWVGWCRDSHRIGWWRGQGQWWGATMWRPHPWTRGGAAVG